MRAHQTRLRQRLSIVARATAGAVLLSVSVAPVGNAALAAVRTVGTLPFVGPAVVDTRARIWYEFELPTSQNKATVYRVQTRNLDTLKPLKTIPLPSAGVIFHNGRQPMAVNDARGQLYTVYYDGSNAPHIAVIDGRAGKIVGDFASLVTTADKSAHVIYGLGYHAPSNALYVAWQIDTTPVANKAATTKLMVSELDGTTGAVRWSVPLDGCTAFTTRSQTVDGTEVFRSATRPAAYVSCRSGKPGRNVEPGATYAVKLNLKPSGPPTVERFLLPGASQAMAFAPATDRLMIAITGTQSGVLVFDGDHEAFIGLIPGAIGTLSADPRSGRLYACANNAGLVVADAGIATPVPLGESYEKITCGYGDEPVVVDSVHRKAFLKSTDTKGVAVWRVVRDDSPAYVPEPADNPDAETSDVAEREGLTTTSFGASGAAYGMRTILVGGPRGALENWATPVPYQILNGINKGMQEATGGAPGGPYSQDPPNIAYANRDVWFGRISEAKLDAESARATGTGADRNNYVDSDLAALSNPEVVGQRPADSSPAPKLAWPKEYEQDSCLSLGGTTDKPKVERSPDLTLDCSLGKYVKAKAAGPRQTTSIGDQITVGDASSEVTLTRDAKLGAVTTVVSHARNVAIGGVAFINDITVTAKTWARGRKGTAGSSYQREFSGVRIVGSDGKPVYECNPPADCNEFQVVEQINAALGTRLRVRLPDVDPTLRGTPGGAKAVIQRGKWEHLEQQTLNGQQADDATMPGVEFEIVLDNLGQSRLIVQLAGVAAESSYNILLVPQFGSFPDSPQPGSVSQPSGPTGGGSGGDDSAGKAVTTKSAPTTVTQTFVDKVRSGMRWVFGYNEGAPLVFVTWALFSLPVYLGVRRRLLGNVIKGGL